MIRALAARLRDHLAKHRCGLCLEWHPFGMEPHRTTEHAGDDPWLLTKAEVDDLARRLEQRRREAAAIPDEPPF